MSRDVRLADVPVRYLPRGYVHVEVRGQGPAVAARMIRARERAGEYRVATPIYLTPNGTVWCRVRRHRVPPRTLRRVVLVAGAGIPIALVGWLITQAVRTVRGAVDQPGPALGFLLSLALVLFVVALRRRR